MEEHQRNAIAVGQFLEQHPAVLSVRCPFFVVHMQNLDVDFDIY